MSHIGQTNTRTEVRKTEHDNAVKKKEATSSLIQHILETGQKINFNSVRTLANTQHTSERLIKEAIEIEKQPNSKNKRNCSSNLPASRNL